MATINLQRKIAVGTGAAVTLLPATPNRVAAIIKTDSDNDLHLQFDGTPAASGTSLPITKATPYQMSDMLGNLTATAISAISASGTINCYVVEFVR